METIKLHVSQQECKSLLQKNTYGKLGYSINPYSGCSFGCSFCYVRALRKFRDLEYTDWGNWVTVKSNALEMLRSELRKIDSNASILIGTATDGWQPAEKTYGISRAILEELSTRTNPVSIITRSPHLLRDIDLLSKMARNGQIHVNLSLSSFDDNARKVFEPKAPSIASRMHLARTLVAASVPVTLFWAPLLPGVSDFPEAVKDYFQNASEMGIDTIMCDLLNYKQVIGGNYSNLLREYYIKSSASRCQDKLPGLRTALNRTQLASEIRKWAAVYSIICKPGFG